MDKLIQKKDTHRVIGLCMNVHNELGFGFAEIVYKDALELECLQNEIAFEREKQFLIRYKSFELKRRYYADFVMMGNIIVEIKANREGIGSDAIAQTLIYLKVSGCKVGLIINFGKSSLEYKRVIL